MQTAMQAANQIRQPNSAPSHINIPFINIPSKTIYIPVYLRILIKSIKSISFQSLQASLNMTILMNTNTWGLPEYVRNYIANNISLSFNRNQKLKLQIDEDYNVGIKEYTNMLKILYNKQYLQKFPESINNKLQQAKNKTKIKIGQKYLARLSRIAKLEPYILFTPFQLIDLVFSVQIRELKIQDPQTGQQYKIVFNIMKRQKLQQQDCSQEQIMSKMIQTAYLGYFGQYRIAPKRLIVQYTSQASSTTLMKLGKNLYNFPIFDHKREKTKNQVIRRNELPIKYAHFHIPLIKNPITVLTTQFIPLVLFSVINLAIYTQGPSLGGRISAIATIMLAFISLIPSLRESIPVSPTLTAFQLLVYLQSFTSVLCLLQSLIVQDENESNIQIYMTTYEPLQDYLWLISLSVTIIITILPLLMYFWYEIYLYKQNFFTYNKSLKNDKTFQSWKGCEEGNRKFLKQQILNDILFAHQKNFDIFSNLMKINQLLKSKSQTKIIIKSKPKKQFSRHMSLEEVNDILKNSSLKLKRKKITLSQKQQKLTIQNQIQKKKQIFNIYDQILKSGLRLNFISNPNSNKKINENNKNYMDNQSQIWSPNLKRSNQIQIIQQQSKIENEKVSQKPFEGKIFQIIQKQQTLPQVKKQEKTQENMKKENICNQQIKSSLYLDLAKLKISNQLINERYITSQRKLQLSDKQTEMSSRTESFLSDRKHMISPNQLMKSKAPIVRRVIGRRVEVLDRKNL